MISTEWAQHAGFGGGGVGGGGVVKTVRGLTRRGVVYGVVVNPAWFPGMQAPAKMSKRSAPS